MKKGIAVIYCLVQLLSVSYGQTKENAHCSIYFYRLPNFSGSAVKMKILMNEMPVIKLRNASMYRHVTIPGEYTIECRMANTSRLKIKMEPGKTYYIKCYINTGFWSGIPVLELEDSINAQAVINGATLTNQVYEPLSMERPKARLGINIGGGGGFESIQMGYTEENEELILSTGGGFGIGAGFGYEVKKDFDLSLNSFYQSGAMSPPVNNADASFQRIGVIITPALIIPIKGGDFFRFRLGAGPGFYVNNNMEVNFSKAGGGDYILKYKPAIGFHSSFIFESNFSEKGSFSMGLKLYNVNYKYNPDGSTGTSNDSKVKNPNGSGLDFLFGYYFHF